MNTPLRCFSTISNRLGRGLLSSLMLLLLPMLGWGQVVISQVYGGGGNAGATYQNDFVELFNPTTSAVTVTGWTLQYASATGAFSGTSTTQTIVLSGTINPGKYFLVQGAGGTNGVALPATPDQSATGSNFNLANANGKVALARNNTTVTGPTATNVSDFVGYGTANQAEGGTAAPAPSVTTSIVRASGGCTDANVNSTDFVASASGTTGFAPRNSGTTANSCSTTSPTLITSPTSRTGFTYVAGSGPSASQNYVLSGSNLTAGPVVVTAPTDYEVSLDGAANATYSSSVSITYTAPTLGNTTVYVRLKAGLATGTYNNETVANSGGGASASVTVSGSVSAPAPVLLASPSSLSGFSTTAGAPSAAQTYALTGTNVTAAVTVTAPTGYAVSLDGTTYAGSVNATAATVNTTAGQTIYVRLTGASAGAPSGNVTNASSGATTVSVAVSGTVAAAPLLVATGTLSAFNTLAGTASAAQTYTLSGSNLTDNVTVTAPTGFEVAQDGTTYASTQALTPSSGSVSATISVRLAAATAAGTYSGNVTNASAGATTQSVAVTGTVVGKPTGTPATTAATPAFNSVVLNLTAAADGTNLLVVVRPATSTATAPADQTTYTASTTYGAGTALGSGFVVFAAANATNVTVTGLTQSTAYTADIYAYNRGTANGFESYGLNNGSVSFTTPVQPTAAAGQLALEENFDYPSGTQLATSNTAPSTVTGWQQNQTTSTNPVTTSTGNLSSNSHQYPQGVLTAIPAGTSTQVSLATAGQDVYKLFTQPTGTTAVYAAALLTVNSAQGGDYFLHFLSAASSSTSTNFRERVYVKTAGATTFNIGITLSGETPINYNTTAYTIGTTYLVVLKYENTAATGNVDAASLFVVDPTAVPTSEPATPTVGPITTGNLNNLATIDGIALRQGSAGSAPTVTVDALRIASGWGAAVGRVVYTTASNTITAGDYYSLRVAGVGAQVSTSGTVRLEKQLNLDGGQVFTSTANPLVLRARPIIGDGFDILVNPGGTSFIDGPVARESVDGSSLLFPIGRNGNYRPLTLNITTPPSGTTTYTAVQTEGQPADQVINAPLTRISRVRYFSVTPSPTPAAGVFKGTVSLSFGNDDVVTDPSLASFVVAKSDGSGWNSIGRGVNTASSLTSDTFQDFSDFILASTSADVTANPLPVQLTSFTAARTASGVQVAWATASELGSDHFEVERSLDGTTFGRVASVPAQGNTTRAHSYTALDRSAPAALLYYRLRQVDRDGTVAYSPTVTVATGAGATAEFALAPNPAHASISFLTEEATAYIVRNPLGQAVRTGTTHAGTNTLAVDELPAGVYLFELHGAQGRVVRRFIKE